MVLSSSQSVRMPNGKPSMIGITVGYVADVGSKTISARRGSQSRTRQTRKYLRQHDRMVWPDPFDPITRRCPNCVSDMRIELKENARELRVAGTTSQSILNTKDHVAPRAAMDRNLISYIRLH